MRSFFACALLVASCSPGRPAGTDAAGLDAPIAPGIDAPIAPGLDAPITPGTDAPIAPGTDTPPAPDLALCRLGCATEAECVTTSPAFDANNYDCVAGRCLYTGCVDDAECQATFSDTRYACRDVGAGTPTCTRRCTAPSDCASPSAAYDADNYACDGRSCRYLGCNDDAECQSTFADARYVCREVEVVSPVPLPTAARNCVLGCSVGSDCSTASAAFDADNYECASGTCRYTGCNDAAECQSTFADARYVCD